jgi:hypothetical protein
MMAREWMQSSVQVSIDRNQGLKKRRWFEHEIEVLQACWQLGLDFCCVFVV